MFSNRLLVTLFVFAVVGLMINTAASKAAPQAMAGPTTVSQAAFPLTVKAGAYSLLNVVLDFAPGAGVPKHKHGGPVQVTVLEGEITLQQGGTEKTVKAGQSWTEQPGQVHAVVNKSSMTTRVLVNILLPKGAAATTLVK